MVFFYHAFPLKVMTILIPLSLYILPLAMRGSISIRFSFRDLSLGLIASFLILLPLMTVTSLMGKGLHWPESVRLLVYQFLGVALPEEVFFRGFLQEEMGNNARAVLIVSILFSIIHLPQLIFYGELLSPLTLFPSLVMGYLYLKTRNVLTPTVFHFLANMAYIVIRNP